MVNAPLVSVIMAVYNGEPFLRPAVDSILGQSFTDFELIVVDDASTDGSAAILAGTTDPRLRPLCNSSNLGLTRSLNVALRAARGEYIARQDADDLSHPDRLRRQAAYLQAHPRVGLVHSDYIMIDGAGRMLEVAHLPQTDAELRLRLEQSNTFVHGSIMVRRALLEAVGGYCEAFPVAQDYDLYLRLSERCELANLPETLYSFRLNRTSVSRSKRPLQLAYAELARDRAKKRRLSLPEGPLPEDVLAAFPPDPARLFRDARGTSYLYYASGDLVLAAEAVERALAYDWGEAADARAWEEWALAKAHHRSDACRCDADGESYLIWLGDTLRAAGAAFAARLGKRWLGRFYADRAYQACRRGEKGEARRLAWLALRRDPRWAFNRGLWKNCIFSL